MSRIEYNLLSPLISRTISILLRYGVIPPPPRKVLEIGGAIKVDYLGQAARAQRSEDSLAIERWMSGLMGMSEAFPEMRDLVDTDEAGRVHAFALGVPAKVIRSASKIKSIRDTRKKEVEKQRKLEQANLAANTAKDAAGALQSIPGGLSG